MRNTLRAFKTKALARQDVRREYDELKEEFELFDEMLRARTEAGFTRPNLQQE